MGVNLTESHWVAIFRSPSFGLDIVWDGNCHVPIDDPVNRHKRASYLLCSRVRHPKFSIMAGSPSCGSVLISPVRGGGGGGGGGKWIGKNVKTGILNDPSPGETEIKISHLFFQAHTSRSRRRNESWWEKHCPIFQNMSMILFWIIKQDYERKMSTGDWSQSALIGAIHDMYSVLVAVCRYFLYTIFKLLLTIKYNYIQFDWSHLEAWYQASANTWKLPSRNSKVQCGGIFKDRGGTVG